SIRLLKPARRFYRSSLTDGPLARALATLEPWFAAEVCIESDCGSPKSQVICAVNRSARNSGQKKTQPERLGHRGLTEHAARRNASIVKTVQVRHRAVVAGAEPLSIVFAQVTRYMRMTELVAVCHVRRPVILEVSPRAFDSVVESLTLGFAELRWR